MDASTIYHRTFLPDGPYVPVCNQGCHGAEPRRPVSGRKLTPFAMPDWAKVDQPRTPFDEIFRAPGPVQPAPKPEPYFTTQRRFRAVQITANAVQPIWIVEKVDQEFSEFATAWEREYSRLVSPKGIMDPVVDQSLLVVGHMGTVSERSMIRPERSPDAYYLSLAEYLSQFPEIPIFVSYQSPHGWVDFDGAMPATLDTVVTGIDGEVVAGQYATTEAGAISVDGPVDYITAGFGLGKLAIVLASAIGKGVLKSLSRRAASGMGKLLAGPTRELAERAAAQTLKQQADELVPALRLSRGHDARMGIPEGHFRAMVEAAQEVDSILIFRANKQAAVELIRRGAPGKPKFFEFKSNPRTGVLTATSDEQIRIAWRHDYFVVDADGVARRTVMRGGKEVTDELPLDGAFWQVEKGQVIDPLLKKPVVGDYDLLGVAPMRSTGRNISVVPQEAMTDPRKGNWIGPDVEKAASAVNRRLDQPRVLHGAADQYDGLTDDVAYAVFPDGRVHIMNGRAAQQEFYKALARQPRGGKYPAPAAGTPVVDELAARRRR